MLTYWQGVMQREAACKTSDAAAEINTVQHFVTYDNIN
jgi:hypothetical protein